jgi:general nucleoside transport system permease protein
MHGVASITFRGNQLISGVAINFLAAGLTVVIAQSWFAQGGRTPALSGESALPAIDLPFAEALAMCRCSGRSIPSSSRAIRSSSTSRS